MAPNSRKRLRVIILRNESRKTDGLVNLLQSQVLVTCAWNVSELLALLKGDTYDLFLCAELFQQGDWRDAAELVRSSQPELPIVVFSPANADKEWTCVIEPGQGEAVTLGIHERSITMALDKIGPGGLNRSIYRTTLFERAM